MNRRLIVWTLAAGALLSSLSPWGPMAGRAQSGTAPGAPTIGFAQPVNPVGGSGGGAVRVSFRPPTSTGSSAITLYEATATPVGGGSAVSASGTGSPLVVTGLTNGVAYTVRVRAQNGAGSGAASAASNQVTPRSTAIPMLDPGITWILPTNGKLGVSSPSAFTTVVDGLRTRIGDNSTLTRAKVGLSTFMALVINDYDVTESTPKAQLRANMAGALNQLDAIIAQAAPHNLPVGISLITMLVRDRSLNGGDPGMAEARAEDRRNMQWYNDQTTAPGWMTYSQYARKLRRVQELYVREFGRAVAERMQANPNILVAITGDGEGEMTYAKFKDVEDPADASARRWADYSPFSVLEFRDWLTARGMYAPDEKLAGQAFPYASRYANDPSPGTDGNGDGRTLNGDFGTSFTSWDLRYFHWSLSDTETAGALASGLDVPFPGGTAGGFDPPRGYVPGNAWFDVWHLFRQSMIQRYNRDFAQWVTESSDPSQSGIPVDRWYSAQVPADYLFGNPPPDFGVRNFTSASAHWNADIWPYGSNGVTGYNVNRGTGGASGPYFKTVEQVAPKLDALSERWGIVEWNPSDPYSTDRDVYDDDIEVLLKHRPSLLMPYRMVAANGVDDEPHWRVYNSGFEAALKDFVAKIGNPTSAGYGWSPVITWTPPAVIAPGATLSASTYLNATANMPGSFAYSPVAGTAVGSSGTVTVTATFTPADTEFAPTTVTKTIAISSSPAMTLSKSALHFTGLHSGGVFSQITAPQPVAVNFEGPSGSPAWSVSVSPSVPWLQVSPSSGTGSGQFLVTVPLEGVAYSGPIVSSATITVSAPTAGGGTSTRTISVNLTTTSASSGASYAVSPLSVALGAEGGSRDIFVATSGVASAPWRVSTSATWLTATAPFCAECLRTGVPQSASGGVGSGYVTLMVEPNTGASRTATVKVANQTVTVTQAGSGGGSVPGAPGQPNATVAGNSLTLSWAVSTGSVSYYALSVTKDGSAYAGSPFSVGTLTGIGPVVLPSGSYSVTVTAHNSSGASAPSAARTFTVGSPSTAPGTPGTPSAIVSGTTVSLSWTPSSGRVTSYSLAVTLNGVPMPGSPFNIGPATGIGPIPGLAPGVYNVTVTAYNGALASAPSSAGTFTIAASTPGMPGTPTAMVSGNTVTLTWTAASGSVTNYRLTVTRNGMPFPGSPFVLGSTPGVTAAGVPPGTYVIAVKAVSGTLEGPSSPVATFVIP